MNIKICAKCGKTGLDQIDFNIQYDNRDNKYYYSSNCKECLSKYHKRLYQNNKERILSRGKAWVNNNKEYRKKYIQQYYKNNPEKNRAKSRKHRALKAGSKGSYSIDDLQYIYYHQSHKCPSCSKTIPFENMTVDHIVPLTWGGSNYPANIQLLCFSCNASKGNHHATDYRDYVPLFLEEVK